MDSKIPSYNMSQIHDAEFRSTLESRMLNNELQENKLDKEACNFITTPTFSKMEQTFSKADQIFPKTEHLNSTSTKRKQKSGNKRPRKYVHVSESMKYEHLSSYPGSKRKSSPLEKCPICKKYFRRMKTHLLKHSSEMMGKPGDPLTCQYCNKVFNSGSNLSIHLRTHTGDKPYVCEVCSKGFAQSCNLVNHIRIHTGERPFKCPHCERSFTQSGNLSNHIRLHTDEKPFKCHFCDRAFTQSGNLNSHVKNNHREYYDNPELYPL